MNQVTNAQAVASGAASLILFILTLSAGHALAELGATGLMPAATNCVRKRPLIEGRYARPTSTAAQEPRWIIVAAVSRSDDRSFDALATARHDRAADVVVAESLGCRGLIIDAHAGSVRPPVRVVRDDRVTAGHPADELS
jgi:hypothetical protein